MMKLPNEYIWAFDFDGTLSHLVPNRSTASLDPACENLLTDLATDPRQIVAVISSRSLDDLKSRIAINNVVLAGNSGLEWLMPDGQQFAPNQQAVNRLHTERQKLLPMLTAVERIPGVEIEDKHWSIAVHFRTATAENRVLIARELDDLRVRYGVLSYCGPNVAEIQLLREVSKKIAVKMLASLFDSDSTKREFIYAGDDQNDAEAMHWVLSRKGIVYIVGDRISLEGTCIVPDPTALVAAIRHRFGLTETAPSINDKGLTNE